ncbi:MAG: hypothetical protein HKP58_05740 [Desulfatitalea sp.]|nr:hypothetical protein [Desulfatitalea sp.]NNJ99897.1 hypothetical protein [Desulfatitalea sp.]
MTSEPNNRPVQHIGKTDLKAGDIISTNSQWLTHEQLSHAILYTGTRLGHMYVADATEDGVTTAQLLYKLHLATYAAVFRHRSATPEQLASACQWAIMQAQLHKPYDGRNAAHADNSQFSRLGRLIILSEKESAARHFKSENASFTCSELVFRAFEIGGAALTPEPVRCTSPGMMFQTDKLAYMGRLI